MALITCPECGNQISDKAQLCPKCGAPVELPVKCEECGAIMSKDDIVCPNCGAPLDRSDNVTVEPPVVTPSPAATNPQTVKPQVSHFAASPAVESPKKANSQQVDFFLMQKGKFFPEERKYAIRNQLESIDERNLNIITGGDYTDPMIGLIVSIFFGELGIDRFMVGDIGMGILKLLTCGCCLILWLIDIFKIQDKIREKNYEKLQLAISMSNR